jgi:hypothetical protein
MAKAQMEILGLAVIVVLVLLGMFFLTKFTLFEQPQSQTQSVQRSQIATNFVSTLLNSKANCSNSATFIDLIDDLEEPTYSSLECGGMTSDGLVNYFNETVSSILNQTLGKWGYLYEFTVIFPAAVRPNGKDILITNTVCGSKQEQPAIYPIPGNLGNIIVTLKICY